MGDDDGEVARRVDLLRGRIEERDVERGREDEEERLPQPDYKLPVEAPLVESQRHERECGFLGVGQLLSMLVDAFRLC